MEWMDSIVELKGNNFPIVLIGNKSDLEDKRMISKEEGQELSEKYNLPFFETSNKNGTNVQESGLALIKQIIGIVEKKEKEGDDFLNDFIIIEKSDLKVKKKKKCCKN